MVIGIGIDIIDVERVRKLAEKNPRFLERIFTPKEIDYCSKKKNRYQNLAARFAAKEAFLKAIGLGFRNGIYWTDIEVENDPMGKPLFSFHRKAKEVLETHRIHKALLTLSHDRPYAVAHVILEGRNDEGSDR